MPVSVMSKRTVTSSPESAASFARRTTSPACVNLMELPSRLVRIWRSLPGSPRTTTGRSWWMRHAISTPLDWARSASRSATSSIAVRRTKSIVSRCILPDSTFEKSRMSLMMVSSESADLNTSSAYSRCSVVSSVSRRSSVMPTTPFIGVRISWLMFARNSLLAWLALSAASLARCISCSACLRVVMSIKVPSMTRHRLADPRAASRFRAPRPGVPSLRR